MKIQTKDLKKNTVYFLTYDFWPKGGTPVKLVGFLAAKIVWPGQRGSAAKVRSGDGSEFFIHPNAYLFAELPASASDT